MSQVGPLGREAVDLGQPRLSNVDNVADILEQIEDDSAQALGSDTGRQ